MTLPSLLLSLLLFISMFFVIRLILPHLYEWGFDYGAVKGFFVPVTVGVTLFLGYLAERKLNVYLVQQLHKLFSLKGKKKR